MERLPVVDAYFLDAELPMLCAWTRRVVGEKIPLRISTSRKRAATFLLLRQDIAIFPHGILRRVTLSLKATRRKPQGTLPPFLNQATFARRDW